MEITGEYVSFVRIEDGAFMMGSPVSEPGHSDNEIQHQVTISSFYMCKYPVIQEAYRAIMGNNPSYFKGNNLPVECVSWFDAIKYCNHLSQREGLIPVYTVNGNVMWNRNTNGYRLPTEAEWEYACRAGTTTPFSTGSNITTEQANYNGNYPYNNDIKGKYRKKTTPVGSFAQNSWGLCDMHGNVWEWCWDWYGDYNTFDLISPAGTSTGTDRVIRGGSWNNSAAHTRSAYRGSGTPAVRGSLIGFQLVRP